MSMVVEGGRIMNYFLHSVAFIKFSVTCVYVDCCM